MTGRLVNFHKITKFLIFVITDNDVLSNIPGVIRKKIYKTNRSLLRLKKLSITVFNFIGHEVTDEFHIRDFEPNISGVYVNTNRILEIKRKEVIILLVIKECVGINKQINGW